jgi:hypothetical protein
MTVSQACQSLPAFTTRSLRLAVFLRASGFAGTVRALDRNQALFTFEGTAALLSAIERLERDQARVSPRALERARAELRREIDAILSEARGSRPVDV